MKNFINQFECKEVKAGEVVYDTEQMGNILLFVTTGKLLICSKTATPVVEVDEGYFVLLPTEKRHIITAITDSTHACGNFIHNDHGRSGVESGTPGRSTDFPVISKNTIFA